MTSAELREKRRKMRLTQDQLAGLMGINDWRGISRLERAARQPTIKDAAAVKNIEYIFDNGLLSELLRRDQHG